MHKLDDQQIADLLRPLIAGWGKATLKAMADSSVQREIAKVEIVRRCSGLRLSSSCTALRCYAVGAANFDPDYRRATIRLGKRAAERETAEREVIDALCTLDELDAAIAGFIRS